MTQWFGFFVIAALIGRLVIVTVDAIGYGWFVAIFAPTVLLMALVYEIITEMEYQNGGRPLW